MIPLQLQIKNFLSYASHTQTIDFSPYQLICLSGKNGHGKSALLDAISWALWGQARKTTNTSKADAGLLRLGQTHMMVMLDFECNGTRYRVRREFIQMPSKPHAALDFGQFCTKTDKYIPLTDKTIRKTQDIINRTIRLTFESFTNSAFLRQGEANEFSKKAPKDRKEILAHILGINHYEQVRKLATEKIKEALSSRATLVALNERAATEIATLGNALAHLQQLENHIAASKQTEHDIAQQTITLENERIIVTNQKKDRAVVTFQIQQLEQVIQVKKQLLLGARVQWRTINQQKKNAFDNQAAEKRKQIISTELRSLQQTSQSVITIKEELLVHKQSLHSVQQQLQETCNREINEYKQALDRLNLEQKMREEKTEQIHTHQKQLNKETEQIDQELITIEQTLASSTISPETIAQEHASFDRRKTYYQKFIAEGNATKKELDALRQKTELVNNEYCPSCPLCEQNLSASRKRFLKNKFMQAEHIITRRINRLYQVSNNLKQILITQHEQLQKIEQMARDAIQLTTKKSELADKKKNILQTLTNLDQQLHAHALEAKTTQATAETYKNTLKNSKTGPALFAQNTDYVTLQVTITALEQKLSTITYDPQKASVLEQELHEIDRLQTIHKELQIDVSKQEQRKELITTLCHELKQLKNDLSVLHVQLKTYAPLEALEKSLEQKIIELEQTKKQLFSEREMLLHERGIAEHRINQLHKQQEEFHQREKQIAHNKTLIDDLHIIATALGKDGLQALLIEQAIPEIEQEANDILAKLSDNQAHIIIESLRDLKRGGTKETLDIKISDSLGVRPYELFSGGEAFRIDFSIRVAISKLLARRAGTALQTLIIDEGFGSQDEEGLARIMDAIYRVQDDFSKIIIVSHLPTMKEQFPVHFVVHKDTDGSKINVIEQG